MSTADELLRQLEAKYSSKSNTTTVTASGAQQSNAPAVPTFEHQQQGGENASSMLQRLDRKFAASSTVSRPGGVRASLSQPLGYEPYFRQPVDASFVRPNLHLKRPVSTVPNFVKQGLNESITGLGYQAASGDQFFDIPQDYDPNLLEEVGSEIVGFLAPLDLLAFGAGGGVGGAAVKKGVQVAVRKTAQRLVAKGMEEQLAHAVANAAARSVVPRLAKGATTGASALGTYSGAREAVRQQAHDEPVSLGGIATETGRGGALGAVMGVAGTAARPLGKVAQFAAETGTLGTAAPLSEGRAPTWGDYTKAAGMILGMKATGGMITTRETSQLAEKLRGKVSREGITLQQAVEKEVGSHAFSREPASLGNLEASDLSFTPERMKRRISNVMQPTSPEARSGLTEHVPLHNPGLAVALMEGTRQLNAPVRYRPQRKGVLGYFTARDRRTGKPVITSRDVRATATVAHEFAHALDWHIGDKNIIRSDLVSRIPQELRVKHGLTDKIARAELQAVTQLPRPFEPLKVSKSNRAYRYSAPELFADYVSVYLHDRGLAHRTAPKFSAAFEEVLAKRPELRKTVMEIIAVSEGRRPTDIQPITVEETLAKLERPDPTSLKEAAELDFLDAIREKKAQVFRAEHNSRQWRSRLNERDLEDVGAFVEGIGNVRVNGDTFEAVKKRMTPAKHKVAQEYRFQQEVARQEVNKFLADLGNAEYIKYLEEYLPHYYADSQAKIKKFVGRWMQNNPHAKQRKLPTYADAVEAGLTPLTQDVSVLHKRWAETSWSVAANRSIVKRLKGLRDAEGQPVVRKEAGGPDWVYFDHPAIRHVFGRRTSSGKLVLYESGVWFHPEIWKVARKAFDNPYLNRNRAGRVWDGLTAWSKNISLSVSGFHFGALTESGQATLAGKNPLRGVALVGREARKFGPNGIKLTFRAGKDLQRNQAFMEDAIRHGLQVSGAPADVHMSKVMEGLLRLEAKTAKMPGLNWFTRAIRKGKAGIDWALWEQYHEGLKTFAYYDLVQDALRKAGPEYSTYDIKTKVAEVVNDAFGGQEWESKFNISPRGLMWSQRLMLAPDWTLSNINIAAKGPKELATIAREGRAVDPRSKTTVRMTARYWRNMALTFLAFSEGVNWLTTGQPTWDNEPGHEWDIDITPIYRKLPWYDETDKARRYIRPFKQVREVVKYFTDPLEIMGNKLHPVTREVLAQLTQHDPGSGFPRAFAGQEFHESIPDRLKSLLTPFKPFSFSGSNFALTWPMSKGMTAYKGIRAYERALDSRAYIVLGKKVTEAEAFEAIHQALEANGEDSRQIFMLALSNVKSGYYREFFDAYQAGDADKMNKLAERMKELDVTYRGLASSLVNRGLMKRQAAALVRGFDLEKKGSLFEELVENKRPSSPTLAEPRDVPAPSTATPHEAR